MKRFFIISLIVIISMTAYYKLTYPTFTYKYRMTVEVETPEGIKSGSSVIEVETEQWPAWSGFNGYTARARAIGEAVSVDLGDRGKLFAPIMGTYASRIYPVISTGQMFGRVESKGVPNFAKRNDFKTSIPEDEYPVLIRFLDLEDPLTVEEVDPDDLAASFGPGVELRTITIEATTDPIEWKINKELVWLSEVGGGYIHGGFADGGIALGLHGGNFIGTKK